MYSAELAITGIGEEVCKPPATEDALCYSTVAQHNDCSHKENDA